MDGTKHILFILPPLVNYHDIVIQVSEKYKVPIIDCHGSLQTENGKDLQDQLSKNDSWILISNFEINVKIEDVIIEFKVTHVVIVKTLNGKISENNYENSYMEIYHSFLDNCEFFFTFLDNHRIFSLLVDDSFNSFTIICDFLEEIEDFYVSSDEEYNDNDEILDNMRLEIMEMLNKEDFMSVH